MGHLAHKLTIYWIWKNNKPGTVWSGHCATLTWWWLWRCCCCHWHKWICWRRWSYRWGRHWAFCWWWGWWTVCIPLQQCIAFFCQSISNTVPLWIHEVNIQMVALWEKEIKSTIVSVRDRSCFSHLKTFNSYVITFLKLEKYVFFPSCHKSGTKKKRSESPWGIKPQTFRFRALLLHITHLLHTARISNVDSVMFVDRIERW